MGAHTSVRADAEGNMCFMTSGLKCLRSRESTPVEICAWKEQHHALSPFHRTTEKFDVPSDDPQGHRECIATQYFFRGRDDEPIVRPQTILKSRRLRQVFEPEAHPIHHGIESGSE